MLLEIAIYTASFDYDVWYKLTLIHEKFAEYAHSRDGIIEYRRLFVKTVVGEYGVKTYLWGKLNSIEDKPAVVDIWGGKEWYKNYELHRENDLPAITRISGDCDWFLNDKRGRIANKCAIIHDNGFREWFVNGAFAINAKDRFSEWFIDGVFQRENDHFLLVKFAKTDEYIRGRDCNYKHKGHNTVKSMADGTGIWYIDGVIERDCDLPAIIRPDGTREWCVENKNHRCDDKPAIERADGTREWYWDGQKHRDGDKPAVIRGENCEWWVNDVKVR
jgi:hypothetical protein